MKVVRDVKIENIIKIQQPNVHKQMKEEIEHLSFYDFKNMMKHDSYYRGKNGALRQKNVK